MSELLWVSVPGGQIVDESAILRVLVVPRLARDGADDDLVGHGMDDWPAVLRESVLTVETAPPSGLPATPLEHTRRDDIQPDLWRKFFAPGMAVTPWRPIQYERPAKDPQRDAPVVTVAETTQHRSAITAVYSQAAKRPEDTSAIREHLVAQRAQLGEIDARVEPSPIAVREWTEPDFHRAVALMREHPTVLRALGLIVELSLPAGMLPATALGQYRLIQVRCQTGPGLVGVTMLSPWTRYQYSDQRFVPAPDEADSDIARGMVDLSQTTWEISAFDVNTGVDRLRDTLRSLDATVDRSTQVPLPPLRSTGLSLLRRGRMEAFRARIGHARANAALPSMDMAELTADQLVLGYRVDVREADLAWRPLCLRAASYWVDGLLIGKRLDPEEGHVKANAATASGPPARLAEPSDDADGNGVLAGEQLHADEVVVRWNGWSLALPRPNIGGPRAKAGRGGSMPYDFRWNFESVAGSRLPELRFGRSYQMRIRVADMAGGGLAHDDRIGDRYASSEITYLRFDPVPPPEMPPPPGVLVPDQDPDREGQSVVDHDALGPSGTVERLVVRSDPKAGMGPEAFAAYKSNSHRTLLPPAASFILAEQHGMLDGDDARTFDWVRRAAASPTFELGDGYSWLADPACAGVALYVRPDPGSPAPGQRDRRPWTGEWPDFAAKSLELRPRAPQEGQTVHWEDDSVRGIVDLAPAEQITLEVTSYPRPDDIDKFEIKQWLGTGSDDIVRQGRHPMATPPRVLHLVHAVRRPMGDVSGTLVADRAPGETSAVLHDQDPLTNPLLGVHPPSTAQVDLSAHWDEWHDDSATPTDEVVQTLPIEVATSTLPTLRHQFGDTRHRRVTYTLTATSRFRDYFTDEPGAFTTQHEFMVVKVPSTARPVPPIVLATTPSFRWSDGAAGGSSVRRTRIGGMLRVELARPWNISGEQELLAVVVWPNGLPGAVPVAARSLITRVRRDPIWATPDPVATVEEVMFPAGTERASATLVETGHEVIVMRYTPQLVGDRWCVDVELPGPAATSYCPFVRLAVARYQHESLPGLALSQVTSTELVQLFPTRTVDVRDTGQEIIVTLEGIGPAHAPNRVIAALERCAPSAGSLAGRVDFTATDTGEAGVTAWTRVPGQTTTGSLNEPLGPLLRPEGDAPLRVVVREVEQLTTNPEPAAPNLIAAELTQRTVFIELISL